MRIEQTFGTAETFVTNGENLTIGHLVVLLNGRGGGSLLHFFLEVKGDVAELLFYISDNGSVIRQGIFPCGEQVTHVLCKVTTSEVYF